MEGLLAEVEETDQAQRKLQTTLVEAANLAQDKFQKITAAATAAAAAGDQIQLAGCCDCTPTCTQEGEAMTGAETCHLRERLKALEEELQKERGNGEELRSELSRVHEEREETDEKSKVLENKESRKNAK